MDEKPREYKYLIQDLEGQAMSRVMKERLKEVTQKLIESREKLGCFFDIYRPSDQLFSWLENINTWIDEHLELAREFGFEKTSDEEMEKQKAALERVKNEMDSTVKLIDLLTETKLNYENNIKVLEMVNIRSYKKLLRLGREMEQ